MNQESKDLVYESVNGLDPFNLEILMAKFIVFTLLILLTLQSVHAGDVGFLEEGHYSVQGDGPNVVESFYVTEISKDTFRLEVPCVRYGDYCVDMMPTIIQYNSIKKNYASDYSIIAFPFNGLGFCFATHNRLSLFLNDKEEVLLRLFVVDKMPRRTNQGCIFSKYGWYTQPVAFIKD